MEIFYLGHGCIQVNTLGKSLLIDPFITPNPLAANIDITQLNPDYILLTHGHEDHVADAEAIAKNSGARLIANFEIISWYEKKGIKGHPMNHGGQWQFDFGSVKMVNAVHSSVLPDGTYGGNPAGFIISNTEGTIYIAGDTALHQDMKLIPEFYDLNLAILPIGDNFTMGIDEASLAANFVKVVKVLGIHYETFPYIEIDKEEAMKVFKNKGIELVLLDIGFSTSIKVS
jgi:L-ascorbate metabolism protein UlaG (beta-lactamase superfamily)